jgi:acyl phosphate:glycerol-3-phosphate acyltransferase
MFIYFYIFLYIHRYLALLFSTYLHPIIFIGLFMSWLFFILIATAAYCLGSLSFAVIVSRFMKLPDPHTYGSGNPGATNVLRSGNKIAAFLTLILDGAKGWLAVYIAQFITSHTLFGLSNTHYQFLTPIVIWAVFLGHLFPVFYGFKGGKGVATAAGILIAVQPLLGVFTLLTWLSVALIYRYSSLAALIAAVFAAFYSVVELGLSPISVAVIIMSILLIARHISNIKKLLAGQETKIGKKNKP